MDAVANDTGRNFASTCLASFSTPTIAQKLAAIAKRIIARMATLLSSCLAARWRTVSLVPVIITSQMPAPDKRRRLTSQEMAARRLKR